MAKYTKFPDLKESIKSLAAYGRNLRDKARKTSHQERYDLKDLARDVGEEARTNLLAYALLRGRELSKVESPSTRNAPSRYDILDLLKQYVPEDSEEFLADAHKKLTNWIKICDKNFLSRNSA